MIANSRLRSTLSGALIGAGVLMLVLFGTLAVLPESATAHSSPEALAPNSQLGAGIAIGGTHLSTTVGGTTRGLPNQPREMAPAITTPVCGLAWRSQPDVASGELRGVAAVSPRDIWAVGYTHAPALALTLHWDGTSWTVVPTPGSGSSANFLNAVAAVGANDVWAVGTYFQPGNQWLTSLTMHWNGTEWGIVPSPNPGTSDNELDAVSATASNDVWAVGSNSSLHWNGTQWNVVPIDTRAELYGVVANEYDDVWTVGAIYNGTGSIGTLIENWDGTQWSAIPSPNVDPQYNMLLAVAAVSPTDLWAVGSYGNFPSHTLIEHWNGSTWNVVPGPVAEPANSRLNGVTAVSANDVWAVGYSDSGTLIEHWDGAQWAIVSGLELAPGTNELYGITAAAPDNIWTVGYNNNQSTYRALIGRYNDPCVTPSPTGTVTSTRTGSPVTTPTGTPTRTPRPSNTITNTPIPTYTFTSTSTRTPIPPCSYAWNLIASPNVGAGPNYLRSVSVASGNDIWAVGNYIDADNVRHTLTEHWQGSSWSVVPSPNNGSFENVLYSVSALSANDAWAVGYYLDSGNIAHTLVLHWNGTLWSQVTSPNPRPPGNALFGVAAVSGTDAWAVGISIDPTYSTQPLILRWNGTIWQESPSPSPYVGGVQLIGVTVISSSDVWIVGSYPDFTRPSGSHTLAMHWNGSVWSLVSTPSAPPGVIQYNYLYAVSGRAANDVWAVGYTSGSYPSPDQTLALHWDGTSWSTVSTANPGPAYNRLYSVATSSGNSMWAVGSYTSTDGRTLTLVEQWDGAQWSVVSSANPEEFNELYGVAAVSAGETWTVGGRQVGDPVNQYVTLVELYQNPCSVSTPSPTSTSIVTSSPTSTTAVPTSTTATGTATFISTPSPLPTTIPTRTVGPCEIRFSDVQPSDYFYEPVRYLYCLGAISGYSDNTFRPYNNTTRGQLAKIVVLAEGWGLNTAGGPHFLDVPASNAFYPFVETAYNRGIISGYGDGTFRWGNNVTRGQLSKIVVLAEGWSINTGGGPHFTDVPSSNPFYSFIETAYNHSIISGYSDSTFRPGNNATRGQISKIIYQAVARP